MTPDDIAEWLRRSDGRIEDIFGLWVQGKRDGRWVGERLIEEGHLAALPPSEPDATEGRRGVTVEKFGQAEFDCQHGRSAHTDKGCLHCVCRATYNGPLAAAPSEPGAPGLREAAQALSDELDNVEPIDGYYKSVFTPLRDALRAALGSANSGEDSEG